MPVLKNVLTFTVLIAAQLLAACSSPTDSTNASVNSSTNRSASGTSTISKTANDNAEELGMLVRVPFEPVEVAWKEAPTKSTTGDQQYSKRLIAVFLFSSEDAAKVVAEASVIKTSESVVLDTEEWYPAELIAQGELNEGSTLKGQSYAANSFLQEPFSDGRITRVDGTDYFVLELFAK